MANGLNKAILIGNLGKDPEMHHSQSGLAVANFSLATSESWSNKESGEKEVRTEWHRIIAFGRLGEICDQYLSKGKQIYIEGRIQTREWEDKEGTRRYTTEIVASQMLMLGTKDSTEPTITQDNKATSKAIVDSSVPEVSSVLADDIPF